MVGVGVDLQTLDQERCRVPGQRKIDRGARGAGIDAAPYGMQAALHVDHIDLVDETVAVDFTDGRAIGVHGRVVADRDEFQRAIER